VGGVIGPEGMGVFGTILIRGGGRRRGEGG